MNDLRVHSIVFDIENELEYIDKIGFSGFTPSGRKLSKSELTNLEGMFFAYNRIYKMLKQAID